MSKYLAVINMTDALVPDWTVTFRATIEGRDDDFVDTAYVSLDRENRKAQILYNFALDEDTLAFYLRHELVHVLLADMSFLASNGRSIEMMEAINLMEERVCNVLARNL